MSGISRRYRGSPVACVEKELSETVYECERKPLSVSGDNSQKYAFLR